MPVNIFSLIKLHKTFRALSLDVVTGVLAMAIFAAKLLNENISAYWLLILCLATWAFYTFDHLIDALKTKGDTNNYRHKFHYQQFKLMLSLSILAATAALILSIALLEKQIIIKGSILGIVVLSYFVVVYKHKGRNPLLQKEFFIALVYVAGIWLVPLVKFDSLPPIEVFLIMVYLFIMAWAEGIMAAFYDYENDEKDGHGSFAIVFGKKNTHIFLKISLLLVAATIITSILFSDNKFHLALIIILLMNSILLVIVSLPKYFSKNDLYRIAGEMVFWLPALLVLL
jgi:4-hydroxybenzoate polyprenyltransferase